MKKLYLISILQCGTRAADTEFTTLQETETRIDEEEKPVKVTGLQIYGGPRSLSDDFKIWPISPVDPSFLVVKKSQFNKKIFILQLVYKLQNRKFM